MFSFGNGKENIAYVVGFNRISALFMKRMDFYASFSGFGPVFWYLEGDLIVQFFLFSNCDLSILQTIFEQSFEKK